MTKEQQATADAALIREWRQRMERLERALNKCRPWVPQSLDAEINAALSVALAAPPDDERGQQAADVAREFVGRLMTPFAEDGVKEREVAALLAMLAAAEQRGRDVERTDRRLIAEWLCRFEYDGHADETFHGEGCEICESELRRADDLIAFIRARQPQQGMGQEG